MNSQLEKGCPLAGGSAYTDTNFTSTKVDDLFWLRIHSPQRFRGAQKIIGEMAKRRAYLKTARASWKDNCAARCTVALFASTRATKKQVFLPMESAMDKTVPLLLRRSENFVGRTRKLQKRRSPFDRIAR